VITISPVAVPEATSAVISVSETIVKLAAAVPPNETAVAPVKPPPDALIVTEVPTGPELGVTVVAI
jgi:hypothetical protein